MRTSRLAQSPRGRGLSINISFLVAFLFHCTSMNKKSILPFLFLLCFPALGPAWIQSCRSYPPSYPFPTKPQLRPLPQNPNLPTLWPISQPPF